MTKLMHSDPQVKSATVFTGWGIFDEMSTKGLKIRLSEGIFSADRSYKPKNIKDISLVSSEEIRGKGAFVNGLIATVLGFIVAGPIGVLFGVGWFFGTAIFRKDYIDTFAIEFDDGQKIVIKEKAKNACIALKREVETAKGKAALA